MSAKGKKERERLEKQKERYRTDDAFRHKKIAQSKASYYRRKEYRINPPKIKELPERSYEFDF